MTSIEPLRPVHPRAIGPLADDAPAERAGARRDRAGPALDRLEVLASFVPDHLLRILDADPSPPSRAGFARVHGAVLHVDLVGFVALADRLAAGDRADGAEPLRMVLGAVFQDVVQCVLDAGGDVLKFTGDGLLALWQEERARETSQGRGELALRAVRCALALTGLVDDVHPLPGLDLSLTCAVGVGDIAIARLGGMLDRWELLPAGAPLVQIRDAAWRAGSDEVVLSPEARALLGEAVEAEDIGDGFARVRSARRPPQGRERVRVAPRGDMEAALRAFIPAAALTRLEEGSGTWSAELRRVNAIFVHLPLLGYDTPLHRGQEVLRTIQRAVYRYEGSLNKLSVDDKGASVLIGMGLPPLPHTDDAERALRVALDIRRDLRRIDVDSSIGLATGRAFCGTIGARRRREYTMIGRVVNLAARLMEAADGDILCDEETQRLTSPRFRFSPLPRLAIRGAERSALAYRPIGERERSRAVGSSLVGRVAERSRLYALLDGLLEEQGRLVVVQGEAGIGKSALAEDLLGVAQLRGVRVLSGAGNAMDTTTPFLAWRDIFLHLLDLPRTGVPDEESTRRHIRGRLRLSPRAAPLAALLNPVLPVRFPESETTRAMDATMRARNTIRLAAWLLDRDAGTRPTLLVLEDAHWLDSASWTLAERVAAGVTPLLFLLLTRPVSADRERRLQTLLSDVDGALLEVEGLSPAETRRLLRTKIGTDEVSEELAQLVEAKTRGHPFFVSELSLALRAADSAGSMRGAARGSPDAILPDALVPDSIEGAITRRMDGLSPSQRLLVRVASVIGPSFDRRMLADLLPRSAPEDAVRRDLGALLRQGFLVRDPRDPDEHYRFKHIITREVAYRALLDAQRHSLHGAIARWIEREQVEDLPRHYGLLAHHWSAARRASQALPYLESAAGAAVRTSANGEAVELLGRALALAERSSECTPLRMARMHRTMASARIALGDLDGAMRHLRTSLDLLGRPMPHGRWRTRQGLLAQLARQAIARLLPRRRRRSRPARRSEAIEAARVYELLAEISYHENDVETATYTTLRVLNLAEPHGERSLLARAFVNTGLGASLVPLDPVARHYLALARRVLEREVDAATEALVLARIGLYAAGAARWDLAEDSLRASTAIAERLDHRRILGENQVVLAQLRYFRGDYAGVGRISASLHDSALEVGDVQQRYWGLFWDAHAALRLGLLDPAYDGLVRARALLEGEHDRGGSIIIAGALALTHLYRGHDEKARKMADAAARSIAGSSPTSASFLEGYACGAEVHLTLAQSSRDPACRRRRLRRAERALAELRRFARVFRIGAPRAHLLQGRLHGLRGRERRASAEWWRCIRQARALGMPLEEGLALLELGQARPLRDARRAAHLRQAADLFRAIGAAHERARAESLLADAEGRSPRA